MDLHLAKKSEQRSAIEEAIIHAETNAIELTASQSRDCLSPRLSVSITIA
jgi:hypothetical protein